MDLVLYVADPSSVPVIGGSPPSWMCEAVLAAKGLDHGRSRCRLLEASTGRR